MPGQDPGGKTNKREGVPFEFLSLRGVHPEPLAICQFSLCSPTLVLAPIEVLALVSCDFLYLPVRPSNFEGGGLPCDFTSLMALRRYAFSLFSFLLGME